MAIDSIRLSINRTDYELSIGRRFGQIPPNETLVETLRERFALTGAKRSCNEGACGCCTVIIDGEAVPACMTLTVDCDGSSITTIEGLQDPRTGELDPIQQAFIDEYAFQCGYCTPGIIMVVKALLDKNPAPDEDEVAEALAGNFCRCISQYHVFNAVDRLVGRVTSGGLIAEGDVKVGKAGGR
ncbi:MAG: (2Fe-2S)-binding protein [Coriobacteriales bacterium]|jgi:carbon-monoxide dehydrogenase small subunit|nr:(2Fe-2S)-binding protein [Coriobacteriales bacterium]